MGEYKGYKIGMDPNELVSYLRGLAVLEAKKHDDSQHFPEGMAYWVAADRITELEQAQEWVSVEERLPDPYLDILLYGEYCYAAVQVACDGKYFCLEGGEKITHFKPTHWKPLTPPGDSQ